MKDPKYSNSKITSLVKTAATFFSKLNKPLNTGSLSSQKEKLAKKRQHACFSKERAEQMRRELDAKKERDSQLAIGQVAYYRTSNTPKN